MNTLVAAYTLVVYASDPLSREQLLPLCRAVMRRHPCRALILSEYEELGTLTHLVEEVTHEQVEGSDPRRVCDCIQVTYGTRDRERAAAYVLAHVLPDLPIYIVWGGAPDAEHPVVRALAPHFGRAIFMAPTSYEPRDFSRRLLEFRDLFGSDICDFGWAFLAPWRQAMRAAFNCSERIQLLQSCQHVRIEYAAVREKSSPSAIYLQGWLAAQLGWELEDRAGSDLLYSTPLGPVHVELTGSAVGGVEEGIVHRVLITSKQDLGFSFTRDESQESLKKVQLKFWSPKDGSLHAVDLPTRPREQVMAKLLFDRGTPAQYKRVLQLMAAGG